MLNVVFGKLNVNGLISVHPFLEIVSVTVGLQPKGTVNVGLGVLLADKVPQVVVHKIE